MNTPGTSRKPLWKRPGVMASGFLLGGLLAFLVFEALRWPDVGALVTDNPASSSFIDRYWARQPESKRPKGRRIAWTPYTAISPHLKRAILVSEDINFFSHEGFDVGEIRNAIDDAIEKKESPRGASTLTQQLAKNLWPSPSRNPLRKFREMLLTRQLEAQLEKRRIFEIYMNVVQFGPGIFGATAAAETYFGKRPADLTEEEAAQLAAGLPRPSQWHPGSGSKAYARKVQRILGRMEKAAFLWKVI